jgi:hypothetical protein
MDYFCSFKNSVFHLIIFCCRELCYVLLAGILTSYVIPFVVLAKPTPLSCAILIIFPLQGALLRASGRHPDVLRHPFCGAGQANASELCRSHNFPLQGALLRASGRHPDVYVIPFVVLAKPTPLSCCSYNISIAGSFAMCFWAAS